MTTMHTVTAFPLGNADSTRIDLNGGEKILIDFADVADEDDVSDKRINLSKALREDLDEASRDDFDVVAFTHIDHDHVGGASDFFHLRHAEKYQGEDRIRINTLWVPAAAIVEEGVERDSRVIRQEARHRLLEGEGIRVFSSPGVLDDFLRKNDINPADRQHLITDAGTCVPEFSLESEGFEVFVHSPHASRTEEGELLNRNKDSLALQATFSAGGQETRMHFFSDLGYEELDEIVRITEYHDRHSREDRAKRLEWDLAHLPHHTSYNSLGPKKGENQTEPVERVEWLYEEYGSERGRMISTSDPIIEEDTRQPPHHQAASYYKSVAEALGGEYIVTMEHPTKKDPEPLVIEIGSSGASVKKVLGSGVGVIGNTPSPRAG